MAVDVPSVAFWDGDLSADPFASLQDGSHDLVPAPFEDFTLYPEYPPSTLNNPLPNSTNTQGRRSSFDIFGSTQSVGALPLNRPFLACPHVQAYANAILNDSIAGPMNQFSLSYRGANSSLFGGLVGTIPETNVPFEQYSINMSGSNLSPDFSSPPVTPSNSSSCSYAVGYSPSIDPLSPMPNFSSSTLDPLGPLPTSEQHTTSRQEDHQHTCSYPGCGKHFRRSADLRRHERKHGSMSWHCQVDGCKYHGEKGFYRRDKLLSHQRARHGMHGG